MCLLLKLTYAKFGVSNTFFSKVIKEKRLGSADPPGTGRVNLVEGYFSASEFKFIK